MRSHFAKRETGDHMPWHVLVIFLNEKINLISLLEKRTSQTTRGKQTLGEKVRGLFPWFYMRIIVIERNQARTK